MIGPEKVVQILRGQHDGSNADRGLTRAAIARALQYNPSSVPFRELIASMVNAGYLLREHRDGAWLYVLGRPLDGGPSRPAGVSNDQYRRAVADLENRTPHGARPGPARAPDDHTPGDFGRQIDRPLGGQAQYGPIHGVIGRRETLCGIDATDLPMHIPLLPEYTGPLRDRDTCTALLEDVTCPGCARTREASPDLFIGPDPTGHRPGRGVRHGLLPGLNDMTACGQRVDFLPRQDTTATGSERPNCVPCSFAINIYATNQERRRAADAERAQHGGYTHLVLGPAGSDPACGIQRVGLWLPEGHTTTVFPARASCTDCIAANGGHAGPGSPSYADGRRDQSHGRIDPARHGDADYALGLAEGHADLASRMDAAIASARAEYDGRCTYPGNFSSDHRYENRPEQVASVRVGNDGYDEYERCGALRVDLRHIGEPEADAEWLRNLFEFERCHECGGDIAHHRVVVSPVGDRFAQCTLMPDPNNLDSDPTGMTCYSCGQPYANHTPGARPGSGPICPPEEERVTPPALPPEDPNRWPSGQATIAEIQTRQRAVREQGLPTGRTAPLEVGDRVAHLELGGPGQVVRIENGAVFVELPDCPVIGGEVFSPDDLVIIRRASRDPIPPAPASSHPAAAAPAGAAWAPPEPWWTSRTFEGEPVGFRDEAEEAWRHRVERIDHWRRNGRLSDTEATILLDPMSPGAVIGDEEAFRRFGTAGRFDSDYVDAVERLSTDADNGDGDCRYCGGSIGYEHAIRTGPNGSPIMEHPPWDYTEGHGTVYAGQNPPDPDQLVPGDPVTVDGKLGIFEYVDDDGQTALVTFEGTTEPARVAKRRLLTHGKVS